VRSCACLLLLSLLLLAAPASAQAPVQSRSIVPVQVVKPARPLRFRRVLFLLDVSGSMDKVALSRSISVVTAFASDELQVGLITFASSWSRWQGVAELCRHKVTEPCGKGCLPYGWCRLPRDRKALDAMIGYHGEGIGATRPGPAVSHAIQMAPAGTLLVLATDGLFDVAPVLAAIKSARVIRKRAKRGPIQVMTWLVGSLAKRPTKEIRQLAKAGGGGLYRPGRGR